GLVQLLPLCQLTTALFQQGRPEDVVGVCSLSRQENENLKHQETDREGGDSRAAGDGDEEWSQASDFPDSGGKTVPDSGHLSAKDGTDHQHPPRTGLAGRPQTIHATELA